MPREKKNDLTSTGFETKEGRPPAVLSLLSQDSVHHVDPNEL